MICQPSELIIERIERTIGKEIMKVDEGGYVFLVILLNKYIRTVSSRPQEYHYTKNINPSLLLTRTILYFRAQHTFLNCRH